MTFNETTYRFLTVADVDPPFDHNPDNLNARYWWYNYKAKTLWHDVISHKPEQHFIWGMYADRTPLTSTNLWLGQILPIIGEELR